MDAVPDITFPASVMPLPDYRYIRVWNRLFMKRIFAESAGTFGLVFLGTGAIIVDDVTGGAVTPLGIAVAFGFAVMAMIVVFGNVSGAHINPAVTIGFWFAGRFPGRLVGPYMLAQLAGALLASATLKLFFPIHSGLGATLPAGIPVQAFVIEVILSFILMLVIVLVSTGSRESGRLAGLAIGGTVLLEAYFAGPLTGASMNPARSLGPALVSGQLQHLWIYLAAPVLGAGIAVAGCRCVKDKACCRMPSILCAKKKIK